MAQNTALPLLDYKARELHQSLSNDPQIKKLFTKLDADSKLVGAGVVYIDKNYTCVRLRDFESVCRIRPIHVVLHEIPPAESKDAYVTKLVNNKRESRLVGEAVGTVMSCGAAFLAWVVITGSAGAVPVTGGLSGAVTVLAYGAFAASGLQCLNGFSRVTVEATGNGHVIDMLDGEKWYQEVTKALDIISLAGAASSALAAYKAYQIAKGASSRSMMDILRGMTRAERKRMTEEIIRVNHPGVSNSVLKQMIRQGKYPKRYPNSSLNTAMMLHVKEAIGASLSFGGSALTGTVRNLAVAVYEEM